MYQDDQDPAPAWPRWGVPIRDMTTGQLAATAAYLRAGARLDEVLIRAVQTELTFRQAGIRVQPAAAGSPHAPEVGAAR